MVRMLFNSELVLHLVFVQSLISFVVTTEFTKQCLVILRYCKEDIIFQSLASLQKFGKKGFKNKFTRLLSYLVEGMVSITLLMVSASLHTFPWTPKELQVFKKCLRLRELKSHVSRVMSDSNVHRN